MVPGCCKFDLVKMVQQQVRFGATTLLLDLVKNVFCERLAVAGIDFISREKAGNKFDQVIYGVK